MITLHQLMKTFKSIAEGWEKDWFTWSETEKMQSVARLKYLERKGFAVYQADVQNLLEKETGDNDVLEFRRVTEDDFSNEGLKL